MSVNKVILLGRLGQDPELKYTPSGTAVTNFSLATTEQWTDKEGKKQEKTEWTRLVVWGKLGELCNQYLAKGSQCYVEGKLTTRSWDKDGVKQYMTEVVASTVQFLGQGKGADKSAAATSSGQNHSASQPNYQSAPQEPMPEYSSDDIPF